MNNISIETKRANIYNKPSLYNVIKQYLIDYPLKHSIFTDVPCHDTLPLKQLLVHIGATEIVYVEQTEDPDILNISFRRAPFKWVLKVPSNSDNAFLVLDVDINNIANTNIQNFVDYLKCHPNIVLVNNGGQLIDNPETDSTDMVILRSHIVDAIKVLPSFRSIIDRISTPSLSDTITLMHNNKTVSLDVGIEDDACVLRSTEMYANYQFKHSRFGNISMQRILNPQYPNEVIGACLTTDVVNEILCYLTDKYKKVSLFDYIKPTLNTWACGDNVLKSKFASPNQSYLILLRNYKSLTIKATSIPEQLHFTTTNCFNEEGFIKVADNGEDIEIVLDRTKFQDKEVQAFIDHLIKELNAVVSIKRTRPTILLKESNMQTQYSKNDKLFDTITQYIGNLSVASKPCNIPCYVVPHKTGDVACTIRKCKDGVIVNSNGQKLFKFWINMFGGVSYRNEDKITNELDDVMLDIKNKLSHDYPEISLHDYLYSNLFNKYPPTEHQHTFKINLLETRFETLKITKIDEDKCLLTFDIEECPYSFLLVKSADHDEINVAYTTISLELPESLKPTFDSFVERFNLNKTSHFAAAGVEVQTQDTSDSEYCDAVVGDKDYYPVIIRNSSVTPTKENVQHLIAEGVRLIEEAYQRDNTSITVSDTVSVMSDKTDSGFRESRLRHSRIYRVSSDTLLTGQFIVILPNTTIPQVRAELAHRIGVDSEAIEEMVFDHDYLYGDMK